MRISARCDYACRALLELSLNWPKQDPVQIQTISRKQKVPMRYLVNILIELKQAGLVQSFRGKGGGYVLAKAPDHISLEEAIREMAGPLLPVAESVKKERSVFSGIWGEIEKTLREKLGEITFGDVVKKLEETKKTINYVI